ncbi:MAG: glycosyltransferase [Halobacteriota archaeon]|nr:glycosyltransferase [Halobacteriota archaeon]
MVEISFVVPAYNEGGRIFSNLIECENILSELDLDYEIIVVNDGSLDNTFKEAASVDSDRIDVTGYPDNRGKGYAILHGIKRAKGDLITFIDADFDLNPYQVKTFIEYMEEREADVVIGSKRHPLSDIDYPIGRKFFSKGYNLMLKGMFNLTLSDTQVGLKLFKREVLEEIAPLMHVKRYAFDVEILANASRLGYKIVEAPIVLNFQRSMKWGRIRAKDIFCMAVDTTAVAYRFHILQKWSKMLISVMATVTAFLAIIILYKMMNPYAFPLIEYRILYTLIALGIFGVVLNLPYDKFSERMN